MQHLFERHSFTAIQLELESGVSYVDETVVYDAGFAKFRGNKPTVSARKLSNVFAAG